MKKISIIFAVLAVFMLLASCSNAAGEVDLAGNPINLAGTWEGTLAYKGATKLDLPMSCVADDTTTNKYTDYAGTYVVDEANQTPYADWDQISINDGTTYTYKHLYYVNTETTKTTTVVNSDGSFTETKVVTETQPKRDFQPAATNTWYYVHDSNGSSPEPTATAPAQTAGTATTTTTKTYSAPVKNLAGTYDYTVTTKTDSVKTGALVVGAVSTSSTVIAYETRTKEDFQSLLTTSLKTKDRTVAPTLKPVEWQNDKTESITFVVTKDGLYTLTTVVEETQAAAAAAEATATNYAAAERKLATKTTTKTTTGTVAAWETTGTANEEPTMKMALSSSVITTEVAATENFLADNLNTPTVAKFDDKEYNIRFLEGKAGRKETAKTRMYVDVSTYLDSYIAILDKAAETEE